MTSSSSEEAGQHGFKDTGNAPPRVQGQMKTNMPSTPGFQAQPPVIGQTVSGVKSMLGGMYCGQEDAHFSMQAPNRIAGKEGLGQHGDLGLGALSLSGMDSSLGMAPGDWDIRMGQEYVMGPSPDGRSASLDSHHNPADSSGVPLDGPVLGMEPGVPPHADPTKGEILTGRSVESDEDLFAMYVFKVVHCSKQFVHDWKECPYAHEGETARRRHPSQHTAQPCPDFKSTKQCPRCVNLAVSPSDCALHEVNIWFVPRGEKCQMAHGPWEAGLHPDAFRTNLCAYGR